MRSIRCNVRFRPKADISRECALMVRGVALGGQSKPALRRQHRPWVWLYVGLLAGPSRPKIEPYQGDSPPCGALWLRSVKQDPVRAPGRPASALRGWCTAEIPTAASADPAAGVPDGRSLERIAASPWPSATQKARTVARCPARSFDLFVLGAPVPEVRPEPMA